MTATGADLRAWLEMLERDSAAGDGAATAKRAHLLAAGAAGKADWDGAFALLEKAASQGDPEAAAEAQLIRGSERDIAAALRAFVAPRPPRLVRENPRIGIIERFMSAPECAWLIARARALLEPALVYDNSAGGGAQVEARSNSVAEFTFRTVDMAITLLRTRIAHTLNIPATHFEALNVLHYAPGQRFEAHYDYMDAQLPGLAADLAERGQRIITFLVYLNGGFEGGETDFPKLGWRYKGGAGDALLFVNAQPGGAGDPRTLHAGLPPTSGEKWILSQWVRDRALL